MPQVVGFIGGALGIGAAPALGSAAFGSWVAGVGFGSSILGGFAVKMLTSVALSALSRALGPKPKAAGMRTDQTLTGGINPEAFIFGRFATNGALAAPYMSHGTAGKTPNAYLNMVVELAGIPGHTLEGLIINGEAVEILPDSPHADYGQRIGGRYEGRAWVKYYDGTQTAADPMLLAKYPVPYVRPWTADMVATGICYAILTCRYDREVFQSWPTARFVLGGVPVYDPRRDSTVPGGSGSQRWANPATWQPSVNNAVLIYNILRGVHLPGGHIWGGDIPAADLPLPNWMAAMDACDVQVDDGAGGTEAQYRGGVEVLVEDEPWSVIEELAKGASAALAESGGVWTIRVGVPGLPVMHITDDDLLADAPDDFKPFPSLDQIYNAIEGTYPDPDSNWESRDADPITNEDWEAEDGGRRLTASLSLPATPYPVQASRVMSALIADHRRMRVHVIVLPPEASALQALDVISWTSASNYYSAKLFEVRQRDHDLQTGRTTLTLREVDPDDYDPPAGLTRPAPPDHRPLLPAVQAVAGWAVVPWWIEDTDGNPRRPGARLSWNADAAEDARGIRWSIRLAGDTGPGVEGPLHDVRTGVAEVELLPATAYQIRARLVVDRPTEWSDWISVLTPDVRLGLADLQDDLADWLGTMHDWISGGVTDLPAVLTDLAQNIADEALARAGDMQDLADDLAQEAQDRAAAVQLVADALAEEVLARIDGLALTADRWRQQRDLIRALAAQVIELAASDHAAREEIRRSLTVQLGDMGASFAEQIVTLADEGLAAAMRITTLEASSGDQQAQIQQVEVAMVDGFDALAAMISALSVGNALMFDHVAVWYFDTATDGWTGTPGNPSVTDGWIRPADGSNLISPTGIGADGAAYKQVRARVRKIGAPVWTGVLWWAGSGQAWTGDRSMAIPEPTWDGSEAIITYNVPWSDTVDRIRLDLVSDPGAVNSIEVDWIAVGRPAPGASAAELLAERQARIDGDTALAQDMLALDARMSDAEGDLAGQASAISGVEARVTVVEGGVTATAGRVDILEAEVRDPDSGLPGLAEAIEEVRTTAMVEDGSQVYQSEAIRALRSAVRRVAAQGIEGAAVAHDHAQVIRDYVATAAQQLNTRIDVTDEQVVVLAQAVTLLQAAIPGLATAAALQALTTTVIEQGDLLDVVATSLTSLQTEVEGKASAGALSALDSRVTVAEGAITTEANRIDSLSAAVNDPTTGLATRASQSAVSSLGVRVTDAEGALVTQGEDITSLQSELSDLSGEVETKATASAVNALTTRMEEAEDELSSQGSAITSLANTIDNPTTGLGSKASSAALSGLESRVSATEGGLSSQSTSITNLTNTIQHPTTGLTATRTLADGKGKVIYSASEPDTADRLPRNLWIDLTGGANTPKRWAPVQGQWVAVTDKVATDAAAAAADALAQVATKASAGALSALDSRVTSAEGAISSQSSAVTALTNTIEHPTTGLTATRTLADGKGKVIYSATAPAVADRLPQNLWVDTAGGANTPKRWNGSAWAVVTDKVATDAAAAASSALNQVALKADASAVSALDSRVTDAEGAISSQGSAITSLTNTINNPASGLASRASQTALDGLTSTVTAQGNALTAQGGRITTLESDVDDLWDDIATRASASAVDSLTTRVDVAEGKVAAQAEALTQLGALTGAGVAQAIMRMAAESTPSGVLARIGLRALAGDSSDDTRVAALFLEALAGGESRVVAQADRFAVTDGSGQRTPFVVAGGVVYLDIAMVQDLTVSRLKIADEAVSTIPSVSASSPLTTDATWTRILSLAVDKARPAPIMVSYGVAVTNTMGVRLRLLRGATVLRDTEAHYAPNYYYQMDWMDRTSSTGPLTYHLEATSSLGANLGERWLTAINLAK